MRTRSYELIFGGIQEEDCSTWNQDLFDTGQGWLAHSTITSTRLSHDIADTLNATNSELPITSSL
jgi:hypothetical protein